MKCHLYPISWVKPDVYKCNISIVHIFLYHVGLSSRIDCCTTNNNYQHQQNHHNFSSKLQLLNYNTSSSLPQSAGDQGNGSSFEQKQPFQNRQSSPLNHTTSTLSRRPSFTLQSPLQHRPIVENIISDNNNSHTYRQQMPDPFNFNSRRGASAFSSLRRSDSYSPGIPLHSALLEFLT